MSPLPRDLERWRRADQILQACLPCDPRQRQEILDSSCADDPELRQQVESLLALDAHSHPLLDPTAGLDLELPPPLAAGDHVGPWRLGRILGEGAAALVFEAFRDDHSYQRKVAIKVSKQALLAPVARERFRAECQILARLEHPAIARLYDVGLTPQGLPFLVLEHVAGEPLDQWCRRQQPSRTARLRLFGKVCRAVDFAHRNLVIHRDLKPSNILVRNDQQPVLLDFGIARLTAEDDAQRLTHTGSAPMTPRYASPEQVRGREVSTASDVYSLGLVLCELLTGRLPQGAIGRLDEEPKATTASRLAGKATASLAPAELRGDLDTIVAKALAPEPEQRYPSAGQLADDLDRHLDKQPILARAPTFGYLFRRFVARHRWATAAALLFLGLLASFAGSMAIAANRLAHERDRTAAEAATAQQVVHFLGGLFEGAEPAFHQGRDVTARELLDRGAARWQGDAAEHPSEVQEALSQAIGKAYLELSVLPEARRFLTVAEEASDDTASVDTLLLLGRLEWIEGNYEAARQHAAQALRLIPEGAPLKRAQALALQARSAGIAGDLDAAADQLAAALESLAPNPDAHPALAATIYREQASVALYRGEMEGAGDLARRAIELSTRAHGPLHPEVFDGRRLLAAQIAMTGDRAPEGPSHRLLEELLADQQRLFGKQHQQMAWTLNDLGASFIQRADLAGAEQAFRQSREMQQGLGLDDHLLQAVTDAGLGDALWRQGKSRAAIAPFERALAGARRKVEAGSYNLTYPLVFLAQALADAGRCAEAEPLLVEAGDILGRVMTDINFLQIKTRWLLGYTHHCLGRKEKGEALMHQSLADLVTAELDQRPNLSREIEHWRQVVAGEATGTNFGR
ncbi:MAG: serine/threonine-protein kinase [Acidobacteriota bacterium]